MYRVLNGREEGGEGPLDFGFNGCNDHFPLQCLRFFFFFCKKKDFCDVRAIFDPSSRRMLNYTMSSYEFELIYIKFHNKGL